MTDPHVAIPEREPAATSADDTILPFEVEALDLRGRVVRLGPAVDSILRRHDYPAPVAKLLGEAIVLTVLLGSVLKFEGRFILQTQTDGPVRMLVVDFSTPGTVRALRALRRGARRRRHRRRQGRPAATLLGHGHLAMTIDQGPDMAATRAWSRSKADLEDAAHEYFLRSEQIPTRVRLAVGEEFVGGGATAGAPAASCCSSCPRRPSARGSRISIPATRRKAWRVRSVAEDDAWVEGRSLIETVEDIELIDPALSTERLLYRLFHERGVRVFRTRALGARVLVLARRRRRHAAELPAGRPRPHGRERRDLGDLRVLQLELRVRAGRGRRDPQLNRQLMVRLPVSCGRSSEKAGISMSNGSPASVTMP